jgi:hypothetical protein
LSQGQGVTLKRSGEYSLTRDVGRVLRAINQRQPNRSAGQRAPPCSLRPFACWEVSGDKAQGQAACGTVALTPDWYGGFDEESAVIGEIIGARK